MSVYKRLLTSHLATTGANVKGFTQLVSLNTAADFVSAAISLSESGFYKYVKGDAKIAEITRKIITEADHDPEMIKWRLYMIRLYPDPPNEEYKRLAIK